MDQTSGRSLAPHTVLVASGKGGVGKSTVALNTAVALAQDGHRVGLIDADVYGPDLPLMVGLTRSVPAKQWTLSTARGLGTALEPVERFGVKITSVGFFFAEDQSVSWYSGLVEVLLHQLLWTTGWGELDYLLVDLPPGTADVTQAVIRALSGATAVVVVTPQDVAHLDAKKLLSALAGAGVPVLGAVENMAGLVCPCCGTRIEVFPPVPHERSVWAQGVHRLGSVPLDPDPAADGVPVVLASPDSPRAIALRTVARELHEAATGQSEHRSGPDPAP